MDSDATTAEPLRAESEEQGEGSLVKRAVTGLGPLSCALCLWIKKRHVELLTRLPTKRMATACWDFIVAKSTPLKTAPLLDFASLQVTNIKIRPQVIHKCLWVAWG